MYNSGRFSKQLMAWVRWTGATAAILTNRGVVSVTRTGAGDFQIVIDVALDATESCVEVHSQGVTLETGYVHTSDTSKQILYTNNAGAATDPTQGLALFYQLGYGTGL